MNIFTKALLVLSLCVAVSAHAQTTKKTPTPVKKATVKKPAPAQSNASKAAAVAKAKQDSVAAVNALAMQMAKKIIREDSIKKAEAAQLATDEKVKKDQLQADKKKRPEKNVKQKPEKKEVAKTKAEMPAKEPVKKVPDALKPTVKPVAENEDAKIWVGARVMGIGSFLVGKEVTSEYKPFIGLGGGLIANFTIGKKLSFQPEILYMQEGFSIKGDVGAGQEYKGSVSANVIHVPVLIKYSFGGQNQGFFANLGPYGNYLINTVVNDKTFGTGKESIKPDKTTIEYGIVGGVGMALPMGKGRLLVEARGTFYLGSTEKGDVPSDARIVTAGLSVGYLFPIGN